jgi:hypothetical protein
VTREFQPGDVAAVTLSSGRDAKTYDLCMWDAANQQWVSGAHGRLHTDGVWSISDVRPLLVIDPEDREMLARFAEWTADGDYAEWRLKWVQVFLRSLLAPDKPEEPTGLGAVVEVDGRVFDRKVRLVRTHASREPWFGDTVARSWDDITGPIKVLSEGVLA